MFDALEGSHCLDMGIATGTIFGIYAGASAGAASAGASDDLECLAADDADLDDATEACLARTLQPASNLIAAGLGFRNFNIRQNRSEIFVKFHKN